MRPLRITDDHRETLVLALVAWLCSTPLVLLLAVPFLGWKTAATVVLAWLVAVLSASSGGAGTIAATTVVRPCGRGRAAPPQRQLSLRASPA